MIETGFDPYNELLTALARIEQLTAQMNQVIAVVNQQSEVIRHQAHYIEQFDARITKIEQELV